MDKSSEETNESGFEHFNDRTFSHVLAKYKTPNKPKKDPSSMISTYTVFEEDFIDANSYSYPFKK